MTSEQLRAAGERIRAWYAAETAEQKAAYLAAARSEYTRLAGEVERLRTDLEAARKKIVDTLYSWEATEKRLQEHIAALRAELEAARARGAET
jgi:predicted  nucleic acid-binding Zn-ribbon protein